MTDPRAMAGELQDEYARHREALRIDAPWFATYDAQLSDRKVRYRLGEFRNGEHRIIDWRSAIAKPYYDCRVGGFYMVDNGPGYVTVEGSVEAKAAVFADRSRLVGVRILDEDGTHVLVARDDGFELAGAAKPPSSLAGLPSLAALLTPEQYQLITQSRTRPVIIQGRAGSGKTSVALHRVAWLTYAGDEPGAPPPLAKERILVVMFNKALSMFVGASLRELGMEGVAVDTFHGWALQRIRAAFQGDVKPMGGAVVHGHDVAVALKKRLGTLQALETFVARQDRAIMTWLERSLAPYGAIDLAERFKELRGGVVTRLGTLTLEAREQANDARGRDEQRWNRILEVLRQGRDRVQKYREDLVKFLQDKALLAGHLPDVSAADLATLATYQAALQGRDGSDRRPGPWVAFEDLALLLRLIQLKNGGFPVHGDPSRTMLYDHVVIDEAQDFGAVDLRVMMGAARDRRSVTIVGDVNQKLVPTADFIGWDALAQELGLDGGDVAQLEVAHRSTQPIMDVADAVSADKPTVGARPGKRPRYFREASDAAVTSRVLELIDEHVARDDAAHLCVVCAHRDDATALSERLKTLLDGVSDVRLGHNDSFVFARGVTVTNYRQVKGLEFDAVIVVEPSTANYPVDAVGRGALYTVCTRARDRLDLVGTGPVSALLDGAVASGALEFVGAPEIEPVAFTEEELVDAF